MDNGIVLCLVTALGFGTWPLIARWSGVGSAWITAIVSCVTAITVICLEPPKFSAMPTGKVTVLLLAAGFINGIAWLAYGRLVADEELQISRLAPAVSMIMIAVLAIGGVIIFGEEITLKKMMGVVCAVLATWLLTK